MVINKFGDRLYAGLVDTITQHLTKIAAGIEATQGESFLRELKLRWDHHNKSMQMIRDILMVHLFPSTTLHARSYLPMWAAATFVYATSLPGFLLVLVAQYCMSIPLNVARSGGMDVFGGMQYMDRIYVKHQNKTPVHQLGLNLWRDNVVCNRKIKERLQAILLDMVHRERGGEVIDRALMRSITMVTLYPTYVATNFTFQC